MVAITHETPVQRRVCGPRALAGLGIWMTPAVVRAIVGREEEPFETSIHGSTGRRWKAISKGTRPDRARPENLPAAELRLQSHAPLSGGLLPARLWRDRPGLLEPDAGPRAVRPRDGRQRSGDDRRTSGRQHQIQRLHVFRFAYDRRLGDLRGARPGRLYRGSALPNHPGSRRSRGLGARHIDGRLWDAARGDALPGGLTARSTR